MKVVKQQLKAFYRGQGLTGKRLKRAVWADVGRVKVNQDLLYPQYSPFDEISCRFSFHHSPEGAEYWGRVAFPHLYRGRK